MKLRSRLFTVGSVLAAGLIAAAVPAALGASPAGKTLFQSSGCGGCHTLAAAGGKGTTGTNLDKAKLNANDVREDLTSPPSGMPKPSLSDDEIQTLSAYVVAASKCDKLTGKKNKKKKAKCLKKIK